MLLRPALERKRLRLIYLGRVLTALEEKGVRSNTDVMVVSDHGFSTIQEAIDLRKILGAGGFNVTTEFQGEPAPDQIMMVGVGGSVLFYLPKNDPAPKIVPRSPKST